MNYPEAELGGIYMDKDSREICYLCVYKFESDVATNLAIYMLTKSGCSKIQLGPKLVAIDFLCDL